MSWKIKDIKSESITINSPQLANNLISLSEKTKRIPLALLYGHLECLSSLRVNNVATLERKIYLWNPRKSNVAENLVTCRMSISGKPLLSKRENFQSQKKRSLWHKTSLYDDDYTESSYHDTFGAWQFEDVSLRKRWRRHQVMARIRFQYTKR